MMGLIKGDMTTNQKSKFTLRLTTSSSRKALLELFKNTFGKYGPLYVYTTKGNLSEYNWNMTADLDQTSFSFLLKPDFDFKEKNLAFGFLAGLIDSDGSIFIRKAGKYFQYIIRIYNENISLLKSIKGFLDNEGFNPNIQLFSRKGDTRKINGMTIKYNNNYYSVELSQKKDVIKLLSLIPLKHPEKLLWKYKIKYVEEKKLTFWYEINKEVEDLRNCIEKNYQNGLIEAEKLFRIKSSLYDPKRS